MQFANDAQADQEQAQPSGNALPIGDQRRDRVKHASSVSLTVARNRECDHEREQHHGITSSLAKQAEHATRKRENRSDELYCRDFLSTSHKWTQSQARGLLGFLNERFH